MFSAHHLADWPAVALKQAVARPRAERLPAIDHFRGFAILMMAVMNHLLGVETLPRRQQHTPDVGLTVTDLGALWFIFAIALTRCCRTSRPGTCGRLSGWPRRKRWSWWRR